MSARAARLLAAALGVPWGVALLVRPDDVAAALAGRPTPPSGLVRVLGGRHLVQQLLVLAVPTATVARTAAAVDGLHALSMLGALAVAPRHRRAELISAAVATTAAALTLAGSPKPR